MKKTETVSTKATTYSTLKEMDKDVRNPDPIKKTKSQSETEAEKRKTARTGEGSKSYPVKDINAPE